MNIETIIINSLKKKYPYKNIEIDKTFSFNKVIWKLWIDGEDFEIFSNFDALVSYTSKLMGVTNILVIKKGGKG